MHNLSYENEFDSQGIKRESNKNLFPYKRLRTKTHFETKINVSRKWAIDCIVVE